MYQSQDTNAHSVDLGHLLGEENQNNAEIDVYGTQDTGSINYSPLRENDNRKMEDLLLDSPDIVRPKRNFGRRGELRSVQEIPPNFRHIFSYFPYFNIIQSSIFDEILYSDVPLVISAPTGSGKTVIFELSIIRVLMEIENEKTNRDFKAIYVAPLKALCAERLEDWHKKFTINGLSCALVTGDSEFSEFRDLINFQIIITTPEKWDSITRRWKDNQEMFQLIKLFMIDEVHLLNDTSRGSVLEAIVSRMKTIQKNCNSTGNKKSDIRYMAISATIPNIQDVSQWLSDTHTQTKHCTFGDELRPVKLQKIVMGFPYFETHTPFKFDLSLNYKLFGVICRYSDKKPTLIFCSTRKGMVQAAETLSRSITIKFTELVRRTIADIAKDLVDAKVKKLILTGVGYHHAGMLMEDRSIIERLFKESLLPVLLTTSTLAMGVNLPAHLVIIKSTEYYTSGGYKEYSEIVLLQMIGRAGRPQFDSSATAVIMTKNSRKNYYEKLVGGTEQIESNLHRHLGEHLNSEVVLHTITDLPDAIEWIKSTFLYVRMMRNPGHYGLPTNLTDRQIENKLQDMCQIEMNRLVKIGMAEFDNEYGIIIRPTRAGSLMARYYLAPDTMKLFTELNGKETLPQLLYVITKACEFCDIPLRTDDKKCLNMLNKCKFKETIRFPLAGKIKSHDMKINCLIQAVFGCLPILDQSLRQESLKIIRVGERLTKCMFEFVTTYKKSYLCLKNTLILRKCFATRLWENSPYVSRQLNKIGPALSSLFVAAGKTTFEAIRNSNPRDLERILNRHPPFGNDIINAIEHLPEFSLCVDLKDRFVTITISLKNIEEMKNATSSILDAQTHLVIGDSENHLLSQNTFINRQLLYNIIIIKDVKAKSLDKHEIYVCLINATWVGLDIETSVKVPESSCQATPVYQAQTIMERPQLRSPISTQAFENLPFFRNRSANNQKSSSIINTTPQKHTQSTSAQLFESTFQNKCNNKQLTQPDEDLNNKNPGNQSFKQLTPNGSTTHYSFQQSPMVPSEIWTSDNSGIEESPLREESTPKKYSFPVASLTQQIENLNQHRIASKELLKKAQESTPSKKSKPSTESTQISIKSQRTESIFQRFHQDSKKLSPTQIEEPKINLEQYAYTPKKKLEFDQNKTKPSEQLSTAKHPLSCQKKLLTPNIIEGNSPLNKRYISNELVKPSSLDSIQQTLPCQQKEPVFVEDKFNTHQFLSSNKNRFHFKSSTVSNVNSPPNIVIVNKQTNNGSIEKTPSNKMGNVFSRGLEHLGVENNLEGSGIQVRKSQEKVLERNFDSEIEKIEDFVTNGNIVDEQQTNESPSEINPFVQNENEGDNEEVNQNGKTYEFDDKKVIQNVIVENDTCSDGKTEIACIETELISEEMHSDNSNGAENELDLNKTQILNIETFSNNSNRIENQTQILNKETFLDSYGETEQFIDLNKTQILNKDVFSNSYYETENQLEDLNKTQILNKDVFSDNYYETENQLVDLNKTQILNEDVFSDSCDEIENQHLDLDKTQILDDNTTANSIVNHNNILNKSGNDTSNEKLKIINVEVITKPDSDIFAKVFNKQVGGSSLNVQNEIKEAEKKPNPEFFKKIFKEQNEGILCSPQKCDKNVFQSDANKNLKSSSTNLKIQTATEKNPNSIAPQTNAPFKTHPNSSVKTVSWREPLINSQEKKLPKANWASDEMNSQILDLSMKSNSIIFENAPKVDNAFKSNKNQFFNTKNISSQHMLQDVLKSSKNTTESIEEVSFFKNELRRHKNKSHNTEKIIPQFRLFNQDAKTSKSEMKLTEKASVIKNENNCYSKKYQEINNPKYVVKEIVMKKSAGKIEKQMAPMDAQSRFDLWVKESAEELFKPSPEDNKQKKKRKQEDQPQSSKKNCIVSNKNFLSQFSDKGACETKEDSQRDEVYKNSFNLSEWNRQVKHPDFKPKTTRKVIKDVSPKPEEAKKIVVHENVNKLSEDFSVPFNEPLFESPFSVNNSVSESVSSHSSNNTAPFMPDYFDNFQRKVCTAPFMAPPTMRQSSQIRSPDLVEFPNDYDNPRSIHQSTNVYDGDSKDYGANEENFGFHQLSTLEHKRFSDMSLNTNQNYAQPWQQQDLTVAQSRLQIPDSRRPDSNYYNYDRAGFESVSNRSNNFDNFGNSQPREADCFPENFNVYRGNESRTRYNFERENPWYGNSKQDFVTNLIFPVDYVSSDAREFSQGKVRSQVKSDSPSNLTPENFRHRSREELLELSPTSFLREMNSSPQFDFNIFK